METNNAVKLLIINNEQENLTALSELVREASPHTVILTASNSLYGIELAASEDPDLVLLNITVPNGDSFEVCRKFKADDRLKDIPVVTITSRNSTDADRIRAMDAGADGFLTRPLKTIELAAQIRTMVKVKLANRFQNTQTEHRDAPVPHHNPDIWQGKSAYRMIFDNLQDAYVRIDGSGHVIVANPTTVKMFGYSMEELIGMPGVLLYADPHNREQLMEVLLKSGSVRDWSAKGKRKDGTEFWVSMNVQLVKDDSGQIIGTEGVVRDISERRRAEEALFQSKQQLESFLQISQSMTSSLNQDEIMQMIVDDATGVLGLESGAIYILNDAEHIKLAATTPPLPADFPEAGLIALTNDHPHIARVFTSRNYVVIPDTTTAVLSPAEKQIITLRNLRSNLYLPIKIREQIFGVLILSSVGRTYNFSEQELSLLQGYANQAAQKIEFTNNYNYIRQYSRVLEEEIAKRQQAEVQIKHLNLVLRAIRDVNQLITHENNRDALLHKSCEILVSTRGYLSAWVAIHNAAGELLTVADSGIGEDFAAIRENLDQGIWPSCYQRALENPGSILSIHNTSVNCDICALSKNCRNTSALIGKLQYAGREFGLMVVALPEGLADDDEEQSLFQELTGDVSYALHTMENELARKRHEQILQAVFQSANDGILLADAETGRFILGNQAMCRMLGYSEDELLGLSVNDIHPLDSRESTRALFDNRVQDGISLVEDIPVKRKDGTVFSVDINSGLVELDSRLHIVGIFRDITERKQAEAEQERLQKQILQSQRMQAIGQLAGGIAHDFNNILAVIILQASMLTHSKNLIEQDRERVEIIDQQGWHATRLIRQILDFSRQAVLEQHPLDLLPVIKEHVKLLKRTLPERINVTLNYDPGEYVINADLTRIQQMIMNLAINGRDAMPDRGTLSIALARTDSLPDSASHSPETKAGEWIKLTVSDTGTGIKQDILPHIFEPFFTTKGPGAGTGLGLAQVHGIVGQHGGHIDVQSKLGKGTTFTIFLPAQATQPARLPSSDALPVPLGLGQLVLVVEDNEAVRTALVMSLKQLNYQTLEAGNGKQALAVMEKQGEQVDLVLSDVVMPEMGGIDLLHTLRHAKWQTPLILLTGHVAGQDLDELRAEGLSAWLSKPPSIEKLARTIAAVLAG